MEKLASCECVEGLRQWHFCLVQVLRSCDKIIQLLFSFRIMVFDQKEKDFNPQQEMLGLKVQKKLVYTNFLPYPELIDEESQRLLAEIKGYLGKAVLLKDITPGCVFWSWRLQK